GTPPRFRGAASGGARARVAGRRGGPPARFRRRAALPCDAAAGAAPDGTGGGARRLAQRSRGLHSAGWPCPPASGHPAARRAGPAACTPAGRPLARCARRRRPGASRPRGSRGADPAARLRRRPAHGTERTHSSSIPTLSRKVPPALRAVSTTRKITVPERFEGSSPCWSTSLGEVGKSGIEIAVKLVPPLVEYSNRKLSPSLEV